MITNNNIDFLTKFTMTIHNDTAFLAKMFKDDIDMFCEIFKAEEVAEIFCETFRENEETGKKICEKLLKDSKYDIVKKIAEKYKKKSLVFLQKTIREKTANQPAGCPIVLNNPQLAIQIAKNYLGKDTIDSIKKDLDDSKITNEPNQTFVRNNWFSERLQKEITIKECKKTKKIKISLENRHDFKPQLYVNTYLAAAAYKPEAEEVALGKLKTHLSTQQFDRYKMLGFFLEESKKSKISYVFRRSRPTLAFRWVDDTIGYKLLASLCLHAIAYYGASWCGSLVPTDDVLTHLIMMRADEHRLWKLSSQHSRYNPQADF